MNNKTGFPSTNVRLHVFADTITRAYGAIAYLISDNGVMSKNHVASLKNLTLIMVAHSSVVIAFKGSSP